MSPRTMFWHSSALTCAFHTRVLLVPYELYATQNMRSDHVVNLGAKVGTGSLSSYVGVPWQVFQ